jgi:cephalosporin hydroxylase
MDKIKQFEREKEDRLKRNSEDRKLKSLANQWLHESMRKQYVYNFSWLGRPIIQTPQDIVGLQEIIWNVKPDMIIETGIAHGGSLIFSASMLALLEACGEIENGRVLGIDIDLRVHNKKSIEAHPMSKKITMFQGSSLDKEMVTRVHDFATKGKKILVCLDSNHTHEHI